MTPQEALAQALHDFGRGCICPGPEQHMNVAALTLDALPEGWEVRTSSHSITEREIRSLHDAAWMRTGAKQERERLREAAMQDFADGNIPLVVAAVIDRLLADPEPDR